MKNIILKVFLVFILVFSVESVVNFPLLPLDDVKGEKYLYIPTAVDSKGFVIANDYYLLLTHFLALSLTHKGVILLHHPSWSMSNSLFVMFQSFGHGSEESARASLPEYIDNVEGIHLLTYSLTESFTHLLMQRIV